MKKISVLVYLGMSISAVLSVRDYDEVGYHDPLECSTVHDEEAIPGWALFLIYIVRHIEQVMEFLIIPLYTAAVILYLSALSLQKYQWVERFLPQAIFQQRYRRKRRSKPAKSEVLSTAIPLAAADAAHPSEKNAIRSITEQPIDLSGTYKLVSNENFDAFLTAQGVPWALRRAASGVMPTHIITHTASSIEIRIDAGVLQTSTTYKIGDDEYVETEVRGRIFRDTVRYHTNGHGQVDGIVTEKTAVTEGYVVTVTRVLSHDHSKIFMESTASFPNDTDKETVVSKQVFERIDTQPAQ
jgi:hypothetical protein